MADKESQCSLKNELVRLISNTSGVLDVVAALERRLNDVLTPDKPTEVAHPDQQKKAERSEASPMADAVSVTNSRLIAARNRLVNIVQRLDVPFNEDEPAKQER